MRIELSDFENYLNLGLKPSNVFGSADFIRLNAHKADKVIAAVGDCSAGVVFGEINNGLSSPWSAPYLSVDTPSSFSENDIIEFGRDARNVLADYENIRVTTPPAVYRGPENPFFEGFRRDGDEVITDTSFYIPLIDAEGEKSWNKSARRNLKRALSAGLRAIRSDNADECYNLICSHHHALGYNMAMTLEEVRDTAKIIPVDFWLVKYGETNLAAMYCYRVRHDIVQVISSGDTPGGRNVGAAIFMERAIIDYYRNLFINELHIADAFIDHGPTSVMGVQNEGLAAFKTSFGCLMSPKLTLLHKRR